MDGRPLAVAELKMARDEVRVEMGEKHMADLAAQPVSVLEVLLDVPLRVDNRGDAAVLIGDQIRGVRQTAEVELLQDHRAPDVAPTGAAYGARTIRM
ncbi:MAG: hypothetical protein WBP81_31965 [Solirubrobacteraceae bacterium]